MIKLEKTEVVGWEAAIRGMRNPMNSWDKSDSIHIPFNMCDDEKELRLAKMCHYIAPIIKENDHDLMMKLRNAGADHRKFMRMIVVYVDITAMQPWWSEFDTYKISTVRNSCSKMHKIHVKEFTEDDFEHKGIDECGDFTKSVFKCVIEQCEVLRKKFNATQDKKYWRALIELLPEGYRMRATVMLNYEVLANIYKSRKNHKLDEWVEFCKWIESLPYSELITGASLEDVPICNEIMEEAKSRVTKEMIFRKSIIR